MKALLGANLIDGTGGPVLQDSAVLIDGERIKEVGPRAAVQLPGLIDTHDHLAHKNYSLISRWEIEDPASLHHLKTARAIEESLAAGYTCIRDAGGLDAGFKLAVDQGLINGPRLLTSVAIVSPTGGIGDRVAASGHRNTFNSDPMHPDGVANGPAWAPT